MSDREKCISIINSFEESQLGNIAIILAAARNAVAEAQDDAFCNRLYEEYLTDPDRGQGITLEEAARELGVVL